ncbi:MAG: acyltransferase family protein [Myxococcales bacterium]
MTNAPSLRIVQLDVLRAIAVLLVLVRHLAQGKNNDALNDFITRVSQAPADWRHAGAVAVGALYRCGWIGVDIFFVLSGFLVSGLLFREMKRTGQMRLGRFLVRRGFKIYPAFYLFLALTLIAIVLFTDRVFNGLAAFCETTFTQNYGPNLWGHTWSLAVEEHFYLLLGLILVVLHRYGAVRLVPQLFLIVAILELALRIITSVAVPSFDFKTHVFATHLRIDALFYGVALSYYFHLEPHRLAFAEQPGFRPLLLVASLLLLAPSMVLPQSGFFPRTVGLTGLSLGSTGLLLWSLTGPTSRNPVVQASTRLLARTGFHSYSIYLWHLPVLVFGVPLAERLAGRLIHRPLGLVGALTVYVIGSLVVGIAAAKVIEIPSLRLRDRWFPSLSA